MQPTDESAEPIKLVDQLYDIENRMLKPFDVVLERKVNRGLLPGPDYPFDISKPTQHSSKADFQQTYETV